jgi:putative DNA primase/helicase
MTAREFTKEEKTILDEALRTRKANGKQLVDAHAGLIARRASGIEPEKVDWLWPGRLARGKHASFAGEPGTGKSQLSVAIVAAVTVGGEWPCGEGRAPCGNVIILSAEDGAADTIVPRLIAVGADRDRVHLVSAVRNPDGKGQRTFNLQTDIALLERKIAELGDVVLVVVDPVSSYLGKTDSHKNSEVRGVLEPLSEMAGRTRVGVLTITHFSKTGAPNTTKALHRFIGSIAFTGAPRTAFAVIEDADSAGRYFLLHAKNNLAAPPRGLAYRLEQTIVGDGIVASRVAWESEPVSITANQALAAEAAGGDRSARQEAEEFLRGALAGGPMPAKEVQRMATEHGISPKTLRTTRETCGVKVSRDGFGPGSKSLWSPPYLPKTSIDAHSIKWASMGAEGKYVEAQDPQHPPCAAGGQESPIDPPRAKVVDSEGTYETISAHDKNRAHSGNEGAVGDNGQNAQPDLSIPPFLLRAGDCAQCGRPGGAECAYDGIVVRLHSDCQRSWIDAYEASR